MVFRYLNLLQYGTGIIRRDYEANNLQYVICEIRKKNSKFTNRIKGMYLSVILSTNLLSHLSSETWIYLFKFQSD